MKKKVFLSLTFLVLAVLIFGACSANRHVRDNRHNHHGNNYFARNYPNHNQMVEYRDENGNIVHRATYENNRGCRRANNVATRGAHHYEEGRGCRRSGTGATRYARHNVDRAYHQPHHNNDGLHHSKYDAAGPQYRHKTLTPQAARRIPNPFHRKDIYANECCDKYFYKNGHNNNDGIRHNLHNFGEDAKHNLHNFGEDTKQNLHNFGEDTKHNFERIGKAFNRASARVTEDEVIEDKTAEDAVRPNQGGNGITQIMGGSLVSAASFFVREDKTPDEGVRVPVIMYHSILKSRSGKFVVSPAVLEADMLYLIKQGYTTVFTQDVIDYVKGLGELPEKPIIVTFDDGFYNNMVYALPIFNELGLKGVINIVGHYADKAVEEGDNNPNYSHLSWEQMRELSKSGVFEIGNHTYDMHNHGKRLGVTKRKGESLEDYRKALNDDIGKLQCELTSKSGITPNIFAYPFGRYSKETQGILKDMGFEAIFTCNEGVNVIKRGDYDKLLALKRYNRPAGVSTERFFEKALNG